MRFYFFYTSDDGKAPRRHQLIHFHMQKAIKVEVEVGKYRLVDQVAMFWTSVVEHGQQKWTDQADWMIAEQR